MPKIYGHTKNLFIEHGKYKWAREYEHCIKCGTCKYKFKGRGLCLSCWDKERVNNPKRIISRRKASAKWYKTHYKPVTERKKREKLFDKSLYRKEYYIKNKEVLNYLAKSYRLRKKGVKCLEIIIKGKSRFLPFESFCTAKQNMSMYKEQQHILILYKKYYLTLKNKFI